jgi:hypothetical protein
VTAVPATPAQPGSADEQRDNDGGETSTPESIAAAVARRLERAGALFDERRLPEAEHELDEALRLAPEELRAWRLLARVRLRLGRAAAAKEAFAAVVARAPNDGDARFQLGLCALKAEDFSTAASELEAALRLRPQHRRVQQYLAYAWARLGRAETPPATAASGGLRGVPLPGGPPPAEVALTTLVADEMLPRAEGRLGQTTLGPGVFRLPVEDDTATHVAPSGLLAALGEVTLAPATPRRPGRMAEVGMAALATPSPEEPRFLRCRGQGEIWVGAPRKGAPLLSLLLEDDGLFLREARVVGFSGALGWDAGSLPGAGGASILHFHGRGTVLAELSPGDLISVRISPALPVKVPADRVLGWMGDVVLQLASDPRPGGQPGEQDADAGEGQDSLQGPQGDESTLSVQLIACEGDGVLLIAKDGHTNGQARKPIHERTEPGDHGAGGADPTHPGVHR